MTSPRTPGGAKSATLRKDRTQSSADTSSAPAIAAAVIDLLDRYEGSVTFAEVDRELDRLGIDYRGPLGIGTAESVEWNIFTWVGVSQAYSDALRGLITRKIIVTRPTQLLVYMADGEMPDLPLAQQARRYEEPHWYPVCLHRGPSWAGGGERR